jgi:hypothetical protein
MPSEMHRHTAKPLENSPAESMRQTLKGCHFIPGRAVGIAERTGFLFFPDSSTYKTSQQMRYAPCELNRLLRVAEKYDKLAERYAEWQGSSPACAAKPREK